MMASSCHCRTVSRPVLRQRMGGEEGGGRMMGGVEWSGGRGAKQLSTVDVGGHADHTQLTLDMR